MVSTSRLRLFRKKELSLVVFLNIGDLYFFSESSEMNASLNNRYLYLRSAPSQFL